MKSFLRFTLFIGSLIGFIWAVCYWCNKWFGDAGAIMTLVICFGVLFVGFQIYFRWQEYPRPTQIKKVKGKPKERPPIVWKKDRPKVVNLDEWRKRRKEK